MRQIFCILALILFPKASLAKEINKPERVPSSTPGSYVCGYPNFSPGNIETFLQTYCDASKPFSMVNNNNNYVTVCCIRK